MTGGGYTKTEAWNRQLQAKVDTLNKRVAELENRIAVLNHNIKMTVADHQRIRARAEQIESENEGLHKLADHYRAENARAEQERDRYARLITGFVDSTDYEYWEPIAREATGRATQIQAIVKAAEEETAAEDEQSKSPDWDYYNNSTENVISARDARRAAVQAYRETWDG